MEHSRRQNKKKQTNNNHNYCANPLTIPIDECICVCFNEFTECHERTESPEPNEKLISSYLPTTTVLSSNTKELLAALIFTKIFLKSIFYRKYYLTLVCKCEILQLVLYIFKHSLPIFCDIEYRNQSNLNSDSQRYYPSNYYEYQGIIVKL